MKESRDRIKAAIKNSGYSFPRNRVTVNLAPADIRKEGTGFDLPIAAALLAVEGLIDPERLNRFVLVGELSLDGAVKGVPGAVSAAFQARHLELDGIVMASTSAPEAAIVEGIDVFPLDSLGDVCDFLGGRRAIDPCGWTPRRS